MFGTVFAFSDSPLGNAATAADPKRGRNREVALFFLGPDDGRGLYYRNFLSLSQLRLSRFGRIGTEEVETRTLNG